MITHIDTIISTILTTMRIISFHNIVTIIALAFVRLICVDLGPPSRPTEPVLAVVDQINGAWVHLSCEGGLELTLPLSLSEAPL